MMATQKYITVRDVAAYCGITPRAVHWHLQRGNPIKGVKEYSKLAGGKTSAYLITPSAEYLAHVGDDEKDKQFYAKKQVKP